jgi:hypothetical protein
MIPHTQHVGGLLDDGEPDVRQARMKAFDLAVADEASLERVAEVGGQPRPSGTHLRR